MSDIYVNVVQGDGYAYVNKPHPYDGAEVTLKCIPASGETLLDVTATDSWDNPIALATVEEQTFIYDINWRNMYIEVKFSGTTPPEPPTPPVIDRLLWLLIKQKQFWRKNAW